MTLNLWDPINRNHSLNRGRMAWWLVVPSFYGAPFWYDLYGRRPMALNAAMRWRGRPLVEGATGALDFDGNTAYATGPYSIFTTPNHSVALWARFAATDSYYALFSVAFDNSTAVEIFMSPDTRLFGGNYDGQCNTGGIAVNSLHRVLLVSNGTTRFYLDGVAEGITGTTSASLGLIANRPLYFGSRNGGFLFPGSLDDISIWDRPLSAAEAMLDYDLSRRGYPGVLNQAGARHFSAPEAEEPPPDEGGDSFFWSAGGQVYHLRAG